MAAAKAAAAAAKWRARSALGVPLRFQIATEVVGYGSSTATVRLSCLSTEGAAEINVSAAVVESKCTKCTKCTKCSLVPDEARAHVARASDEIPVNSSTIGM